jgi:mannose-6-phosphate isomerase-like protein (cupin superfamily)
MNLISDRILKQLLSANDSVTQAPNPAATQDQAAMDHTTRPVLMERAAYLKKLARASEGSASEVLKEYPRHNIQLSVRLRSGTAELHERFADIFIVLDGRATLVTGGAIVKPERTAAGEVRGTKVEGGAKQELRAGDVAHIAAGTPHQILLAGDATFAAIVIKVQETD